MIFKSTLIKYSQKMARIDVRIRTESVEIVTMTIRSKASKNYF